MSGAITESRGKVRRQLIEQARRAAVEGRWVDAVRINQEILERAPKDVEAFNRVITTTGHPTVEEMKRELQNAVDLFRPGFDEESPSRFRANTEQLWREVFKTEIDVQHVPADYLSLTGHKFHAPKGVGALYLRRKAPFSPFLHGGHQERGLR